MKKNHTQQPKKKVLTELKLAKEEINFLFLVVVVVASF